MGKTLLQKHPSGTEAKFLFCCVYGPAKAVPLLQSDFGFLIFPSLFSPHGLNELRGQRTQSLAKDLAHGVGIPTLGTLAAVF